MASGKKTSKSDKEAYARYERESRWSVNRKRKINRHLKKHPEDLVAAKALTNIKYRRKKPVANIWKGTKKTDAQLMASFKVKSGSKLPKPKRFRNTIRDSIDV